MPVGRVSPRALPRKEDYGYLPRINPQDSRFSFTPVLRSLRFKLPEEGKRRKIVVAEPRVSTEAVFDADYRKSKPEIRADILTVTRLRAELVGDKFLTKDEENLLEEKILVRLRGKIYSPEKNYSLSEIPVLVGGSWRPSTLYHAVNFCKKFTVGGFKTAVPLFNRNWGKEVMTFWIDEDGKWSFEFHPAELSGKFSKDVRVLVASPF